MKSSLPPLAPNTYSSHKKGQHNKAQHKTPSSSKPFSAGEKKVGRSLAAAVVRKGSYLDDDSVESHNKSSFYFEPSVTSSSAVALRQPTPPSVQKPSFSPHPPSNRPPAKKEDPIKKLYEDLRRAGRQRPVSSGMLNNIQYAASVTSHFVEPKVTIEIASKEELAARDLAESSHPSIPAKVDDEGNSQQQQQEGESQVDSPTNKNHEPQTDPEVACGMIKEGNL